MELRASAARCRHRSQHCSSCAPGLSGILATGMALSESTRFLASQCLRLKHTLEPECGLRVGFLSMLFLNQSLVLRLHRIPIRHSTFTSKKHTFPERLEPETAGIIRCFGPRQLRASQRAQELKHEFPFLTSKRAPILQPSRRFDDSANRPNPRTLCYRSSSQDGSSQHRCSGKRLPDCLELCARCARFKILCSDATHFTPSPSALHLDGLAGRPWLVPDRFGTKQRPCPRRYP
jgi:hypothetical protein